MNKSKSLHDFSKNFSVLFVEDNEELREATSELLGSLFKTVRVAADGKIALSLYESYLHDNKECFDIVISDIKMPNMDGISLSKEICKINKKQKLLIISAYDEKKYFIELINIGVSGFIQKPLNTQELLIALSNICNELAEEKEIFRYIKLEENYIWDFYLRSLSQNKKIVNLTKNERLLLDLLLKNRNKIFTSVEIFEYINKDNLYKEYTADSIKSLLKRLRKKLPKELINSSLQSGYFINQ